MSGCVSTVLIHIVCDKHLSPEQLKHSTAITQSLISKLDMFLHDMELANIDIRFIAETWINNKTDVDSMISQANQAEYTIISH